MTATVVFALVSFLYFGSCTFDNHARQGDYVIPSVVEAGYCHDAGRNYRQDDWVGCVAQIHQKESASPCILAMLKEAGDVEEPDFDPKGKNL